MSSNIANKLNHSTLFDFDDKTAGEQRVTRGGDASTDFGFRVSSLIMENTITQAGASSTGNSPFSSVEGACGVPARMSGAVSLLVQFLSLMIASILTGVLFVHVGGYGMIWPIGQNLTTIDNKTDTASTTETVGAAFFPTPAALISGLNDTNLSMGENNESQLLNNTENQVCTPFSVILNV